MVLRGDSCARGLVQTELRARELADVSAQQTLPELWARVCCRRQAGYSPIAGRAILTGDNSGRVLDSVGPTSPDLLGRRLTAHAQRGIKLWDPVRVSRKGCY